MNQTIRKRIEDIKKGVVPEGYKKTKVGIVPKDWEETRFKKMFSRLTRKNKEGNNNVLTISAQYGLISQSDFFNKTVASEDKSNYFLLYKGEYAYNKSYSNGYPYGALKRLEFYDKGIVSPLYICFSKTEENNCPDFYSQYFEAGLMNKEIKAFAQEGARNHGLLNIAVDDFFNSYLLNPPLAEQEKIAKILGAQDRLILLKEKLIEQKKQQKKYLMQQLLTGKKRLPGFTGEWDKEKLGKHIYENVVKNTDRRIKKVLSVNNKLGFVDQEEQFGKRIASEDVATYKILSKNSVAYNPSRINVGSIALYKEDELGIVSPMYVVLRLNETMLPEYFMSIVKTHMFFQQMKILLAGSVRDSLKFDDMCKFEFKIPSLEEQQAIADILLQADKEIELLQKDLEEEKNKKKALMQLLLTGIVRCV